MPSRRENSKLPVTFGRDNCNQLTEAKLYKIGLLLSLHHHFSALRKAILDILTIWLNIGSKALPILCRFFPSVYYMASSKIAIATFGNLAFAIALCLYRLVTRVRLCQKIALRAFCAG